MRSTSTTTTGAEVAGPPVPVPAPAASGRRRRLLVAYRGLPGSGKTTQARARLAGLRRAGVPAARVSRDDVRARSGIPQAGTRAQEAAVTAMHHAAVTGLFEARRLAVVLVDSTHLDEDHLADTAALAERCGADLEVVDLRAVPVLVCVARDRTRPPGQRVGRSTITALADRHGLAGARRAAAGGPE